MSYRVREVLVKFPTDSRRGFIAERKVSFLGLSWWRPIPGSNCYYDESGAWQDVERYKNTYLKPFKVVYKNN